MPTIYKSGAFLQQCFSVHPLSLNFKMLTLPDKIGIACVNCKFRHRLTFKTIARIIGDTESFEAGDAEGLQSCVTQHQEALHVTEVSVEQDIVQFRCRQCKTGFQANIALYETYQP